ncbi:MAG: hypothetical protein KatS3mg084_0328 [Candidatus Dojkabacteria bacterium]|jgi:sortase A|nr:MAG: hypothetical protein KatS3mg084_0328 [Candidatus Dojkabacteria bacterium]
MNTRLPTYSYAHVHRRKKRSASKLFALMILNFLMIISLLVILVLYGPIMWHEILYAYDNVFNEDYKKRLIVANDVPKLLKESEILLEPVNPIPEPVDRDFSVIIPKINVNKKVIKDVDITDEVAVQEALKQGIGWARGTVEPGQYGNSLLFSHSSRNVWDIPRYNAEFTLLNKLEFDDLFTVVYQGRQYDFIVFEKTIVDPDDVSYVTGAADGRIVTLQTCHPPGSNKQRLIVRGRLIAMQTF